MLENPVALDTLFTIGNVPQADICIQRRSKEAKKKENEEKREIEAGPECQCSHFLV